MLEEIQSHATIIFKAITSAMKIESNDLCFCGSGKNYIRCCEKNNTPILFTEKALKKILEYKKSQGGQVQKIPQGIFKKFSEASLRRFDCLYPNCTKSTVTCHSIPENILKNTLGSHCLESRHQDESNESVFTKTGVGQAGTIPVFCAQHDNDIFQQIDKLNIDLNNQEHLFKIAFKTIAFSFRHVQYLMGIDSQVEIFRPLLYLDNQANTPVQSHVTLQISKHTCEQYLRLEITNDVFRESIKILRKKEYEKFSYFHRTLDYNGKIFFSGLVNPLFDLAGKRIGNRKTPINMALNIFTKEKKIYVLIACPPKSRKLYSNLLNQLKNAKEEAFITFLNEVLESTSNKPLLPLNFNLTSKFIHK